MKLLRFYFETTYYELTYFHNRSQLKKFWFQVSILTCCYMFHVSMLSTTNVPVQHFRDQGSLCIFIMISMKIHCVPSVWRCFDFVLLKLRWFVFRLCFDVIKFYSQHKFPRSTFSRPGFTLYFYYDFDNLTLCPISLKVLRYCVNFGYKSFFWT